MPPTHKQTTMDGQQDDAEEWAEQINKSQDLIVLSAQDSLAVMHSLARQEPAGPALKGLAEQYESFMKQQ